MKPEFSRGIDDYTAGVPRQDCPYTKPIDVYHWLRAWDLCDAFDDGRLPGPKRNKQEKDDV